MLALACAAPRPARAQPGATPSVTPGVPARVRVTGVVYDSLLGAPLAGATVTREGGAHVAFTDAAGRFALDSVAAGPGRFVVSHPGLDSVGLGEVPVVVDVPAARDSAVVRLATPSLATLRARACPAGAAADTAATRLAPGFAYGDVRDAADTVAGARLAGALAEVAWTRVDRGGAGPLVQRAARQAQTDSLGGWIACGLPVGAPLEARATAGGGRESGRATFAIGPRGVARLDLWVGARDTSAAAPRAVLAGVVRDSLGAPRPGARVTVDGVDGVEARTDAAGRFRLAALPAGTRTAVVRALGYEPQVLPVALRAGAPAELDVTLRRVVTLAGVTVRGRSDPQARLVEELDRRRRLHLGYFVDTALLRRTQNVRIALSMTPFAYVRGTATDWTLTFTARSASLGGGALCAPTVWVDRVVSNWEMANVLSPDEIVAVEVYRRGEDAPPEYRDPDPRRSCGNVLFWTRRAR